MLPTSVDPALWLIAVGNFPGSRKPFTYYPVLDQTYEGSIRQIKADFGPQAEGLLSHRFRVIKYDIPHPPRNGSTC